MEESATSRPYQREESFAAWCRHGCEFNEMKAIVYDGSWSPFACRSCDASAEVGRDEYMIRDDSEQLARDE